MTTYDLVVTGGTAVLPGVGEVAADLGVRDGRIATIADRLRPADGERHVDATGKAVLPGAVDSHFHLGIYRDLALDAATETTSSLVGGVTSIVSYFRTGSHYLNRTGPYREIFPEVLAAMAGNAKVDYGFHLAPMTREHIDEMPWLVQAMGVTSFKYYMFYKGLNLAGSSRDARGYTMAEDYDLGHLFELMEKAAELDAVAQARVSVSLHCEQAELLRVFIERAQVDPAVAGLVEYSAGRPPLTERLSIEEGAVLADATGARVNLLHLSSALAVQTARSVVDRYPGMDASLETTLHHLALACEDLAGKGYGPKVNPPIRDRSDNEALWRAVAAGAVATVASDHACCAEELKGDELWPAQPGFGGTALLYPVLLSEGYHKRGLPLPRIVDLVATNPARVFNLPGKGVIATGADADLAIVDLGLEQVVTTELCRSAQDHCPFEGIRVRGWPVATIVRGEVMLDHGEVSPTHPGQYISRTSG